MATTHKLKNTSLVPDEALDAIIREVCDKAGVSLNRALVVTRKGKNPQEVNGYFYEGTHDLGNGKTYHGKISLNIGEDAVVAAIQFALARELHRLQTWREADGRVRRYDGAAADEFAMRTLGKILEPQVKTRGDVVREQPRERASAAA